MNRRLSLLVAVVAVGSLALSFASCDAPICGVGTIQQQQKDGTLDCVPTDTQAATTPCDVDGGMVRIVGGQCVPAVICDPNTTMTSNGICFGTGGGTLACHTPAPGKACVFGTIYNFTDGSKNTNAAVEVDLFDPIALLSPGATPIATTTTSSDGSSYVFQDFTPPPLGLVVVLVGLTSMTNTPAGTGAQSISANNQYHVDAYSLKKADSDAWGFDLSTGGGYIAKFYSDPKPAPSQLIANETKKVAGVTLLKDGANPGAKYFNATLTAIDNTLTATGTSGVAIVASPVPNGASFPTFSGMGPTAAPITWEVLPGGSAPGLVLITRFHPSM